MSSDCDRQKCLGFYKQKVGAFSSLINEKKLCLPGVKLLKNMVVDGSDMTIPVLESYSTLHTIVLRRLV